MTVHNNHSWFVRARAVAVGVFLLILMAVGCEAKRSVTREVVIGDPRPTSQFVKTP